MIKSLLVLVVLSLTMLVGNAHADSEGRGAKEFFNLVENYRKSCVNKCPAPFKSETVFDIQHPNQSRLSVEIKSSLNKVALIQAGVWGDTILEGDYYSTGQTQLDNVLAVFQNETLIAYKITYSERAWFTGDCDFDSADENTLKTCNEGRIHESTFVSPDFRTFFSEDFAGFAR